MNTNLSDIIPDFIFLVQNKKERETLQKFVNDLVNNPDECVGNFFVFYGKGCRGKSTALRYIENLLDDKLWHYLSDLNGVKRNGKWYKSDIDKKLLISQDVNNIHELLELTENKEIEVVTKYRIFTTETYTPQCNIISVINELPETIPEKVKIINFSINCHNYPWIKKPGDSINENYERNIVLLKKLQRFCKYMKIWRLIRYQKTKEFCEWFYDPEFYGGKKAKKELLKTISIRETTN